MERLTKRCNGIVIYVGPTNPYMTGRIPCEVESAGVREMMYRLAAYEDTDLTPEEVAALLKDRNSLCTVIGECCGLNRVIETAAADVAPEVE